MVADDRHPRSRRLSTRPVVFERPLTPEQALDLIDGWLAQPNVTVVHPTDRHAAVLRELIAPLGTAGNLVGDAHLSALAVEHGAELCSSDADFSRLIEDEISDQIKEYVRLRKAILRFGSAVDLLVVSREHAEAPGRIPGSIIRAARREGRILVQR